MENFIKILSVAFGGACGAVLRYLITISPVADFFGKFPFATFLINTSGSFLVGFLLIFLTDKFMINENLRLSILVGFIGAFTTFSTFELEIFSLVRERYYAIAFLYLFMSVAAGFIGVSTGIWLAKRI